MSIFVLLAAVWVAFAISNVADAFPPFDWVRLPRWAFWGGLIALVTWCMDDGDSSLD